MQELDQVNQEITSTKNQIDTYPSAIQKKKEELIASIKQVRRQNQSISQVSGSDEEDFKLIADVQKIHLRAIDAIEKDAIEKDL